MVSFSLNNLVLLSLCASLMVTSTTSSSIQVSGSCFTFGEDIPITFQSDNPMPDDFIAFYDPNANPNALSDPTGRLWLWTCGTRRCSVVNGIRSGSLLYKGIVPLGTYKIALVDNSSAAPHSGRAVSQTFSVRQSCNGAGASAGGNGNVNGAPAGGNGNGVTTGGNSGTAGGAVSGNTGVSNGGNTSGGSTGDSNGGTQVALRSARRDIEEIIMGRGGNQKLAPKFLRLGFHDCIGGCDGCVDLTNMENTGLQIPINALRPVVATYAGKDGITRADLWALAAAVGADVLQTRVKVFMNMDTVGRVNCEDAHTFCLNGAGVQQECSPTRGPHRNIPGMVITSRDLFGFFFQEFGFSVREGVALMGAHTIGELRTENSGVQAHGWLRNNNIFDNEYYHELIGGTSRADSLDVNINDAPNWKRSVERNNNGFPDRHIFTGNPDGVKIAMLPADICMVRELDATNMDADGRVNCKFRREGRCPHNDFAIEFCIDYTFDNALWLNDFHDVLIKLLNHGYAETNNCDGQTCFLTPI